jgi:hypothetical protein
VALQSAGIAQKIASIQLWRQFQKRCIKWCRERYLPTVFQNAGYSHTSGRFKTATNVIAGSLIKCQLKHFEAVFKKASKIILRQFAKKPTKSF